MPLRIRRGTNAERLTITPAEGELIYTTDSKRVYVGDGTTTGGVELTAEASIDNLQTNLNLNNFDIIGTGNININGDVTVSGNLNGTFSGSVTGDIVGSLFADDSTTLVDALTGTHYGLFDGNLLGNVTGNVVGDVTGNVFGNVTGNVTGNLLGDLIGNVDGNLVGDVVGSVFANDSSLLIDGITGTHYGVFDGEVYLSNTAYLKDNVVNIFPIASSSENEVKIINEDSRSILKLSKHSVNDLSLSNTDLGRIIFEREDPINGMVNAAIITGRTEELIFGHDSNGAYNPTRYFRWQNGKLAIGKLTALTTLDVAGDGSFDGTLTAAAFKGSIVGDDSTTIVDGINGTITATGFIQFGSYTDAEIAEITPSNGMVYYNTTDNKFRGYQNGAWINLDDGSAA